MGGSECRLTGPDLDEIAYRTSLEPLARQNRLRELVLATASFAMMAALALSVAAQPRTALQPMPAQEWFNNYKTYLSRAARVEKSAEAHYRLGRWAWEHGLEDEAWEQWVKALAADPDHLETRKATGFVDTEGGWERPGQVNPEWVSQVDAAGRGLSFTVAIEDDASAAFFDELSWRLRRLNWFLWKITEGQVYLKEVKVVDLSTTGRFVVPAGQLDVPVMAGGGASCANPGRPDWRVISGGRCYVRILGHEMLHGLFGLPDERHGCYCLMQGGLYGIKTPDLRLCDAEYHRPDPSAPESCWSIIQRRDPSMTHPNPADYGRAPEVKIEVVDR